MAAQGATARIDGTYNVFAASFSDQCTYWASQRYHALTGIWVPCTGNGYQWASEAASSGWRVTSQPPTSQPSIICLQPGVQLADRNYGHVGVVERINSDGSVYCSNFNVYPHIGDKVVVYVTFRTGNGVSFIYAGNNIGSLNGATQFINTLGSTIQSLGQTYTLSSNSTIADVLQFVDQSLDIKNPFDGINASQDNLGTISFTDPISWLQGLGMNLVQDLVAVILRMILVFLGLFILFRIFAHFIDFSSVQQNAGQLVEKIAPLLMAG